jgi:transcription elongation factor SPT5
MSYDNNGVPKYVPPDLWLIDSAFRNKNVIVEISRRAQARWVNGEHDGVKGYVITVFDPRNETTSRTAQIMPLDANHNAEKIMTVPIEYLVPVNPTSANQSAIILEGPKKGDEVVLREETSSGQWTVGPYQESGVFSCAGDRMVKVQKDLPIL